MKRLFLLFLLVLLAVPTVEAKRRETPEEIERKTRKYEGWEQTVSGRFALIFYQGVRTEIEGQAPERSYKAQARLGGSLTYGGGYLINNHWRVGAEVGVQPQYNHTLIPAYLTAHYFYGKRKNCLFNFLNLGTNVLFNKGVRFGATGAGGVGVRLQSPDSDHKFDIMIGYQAIMLNPRPVIKEPYCYSPKDVNRKVLNQSVFIGIGVNF